jgi:hypothetical protein
VNVEEKEASKPKRNKQKTNWRRKIRSYECSFLIKSVSRARERERLSFLCKQKRRAEKQKSSFHRVQRPKKRVEGGESVGGVRVEEISDKGLAAGGWVGRGGERGTQRTAEVEKKKKRD